MVKRLVDAGCDPRITDPRGVSPIDQAILHNNSNVESYLRHVVKEANEGKREFIDFAEIERQRCEDLW